MGFPPSTSCSFMLLLYHGSMLRHSNMKVVNFLAVHNDIANGAYLHFVRLCSYFNNLPLLCLQIFIRGFLSFCSLATCSFSFVRDWSFLLLHGFCCRLGSLGFNVINSCSFCRFFLCLSPCLWALRTSCLLQSILQTPQYADCTTFGSLRPLLCATFIVCLALCWGGTTWGGEAAWSGW